MEQSRKNPQFLRTDRAITQALIRLLRVKPFEKITVSDILEEAPVTRSTFYQHFHDKYEIAEKMQSDLVENRPEMQNLVRTQPPTLSAEIQKRIFQNQDYISALLKIHTEHVDIREAFVRQLTDYYLADAVSPTAAMEANVYANAITAYQLTATDALTQDLSLEHFHRIMLRAMLKMFELQDDTETIRFLEQKIKKRFQERRL